VRTLEPGILSVASAFPDPPFELSGQGHDTGFDIELMRALCETLGVEHEVVKFEGSDFNRIFDGLASGAYDAVISGTTITPEREGVAWFTDPYLESGQSLVVNTKRTPTITSVDDLDGRVVGIQVGNTSDAVAKKLKAKGAIAGIKYYPYSGIFDALDDLTAGTIGAVIKLLPVTTWLVKDRPDLAVVQEIPTHERLAIACALDNHELCDALNDALHARLHDGTVEGLRRRWLE
jgi:polar amino acid transport system substrate-binding protein